jgi:hypothetical protein
MRSPHMLLTPALLLMIGGCEQKPALVYVLEAPQVVTLATSASASKVKRGETVVLHAQRRSEGKWKQIRRDELQKDQCWLYQPPLLSEAEVADNLLWEVDPEDSVRFSTEYRMDHTRVATMMVPGVIKLTPVSAVKCEKERAVEGPAVEIEVS